jgi:hypothetical protein
MNKNKIRHFISIEDFTSFPQTRIHLESYIYSIYSWLKVNSSMLHVQEFCHYVYEEVKMCQP